MLAHLEKLGACSAEIYRGFHAWGGEARQLCDVCLTDVRQLLCRARVVVAGPIAGELLGDGKATDNIEELLKGRFLLVRAAELVGCRKGPLWRDTLVEAARRVEFFTPEILDLSALLAQRNVIRAFEHPVARILRRVDTRLVKSFPPLSQRSENILADIAATFSEFSK